MNVRNSKERIMYVCTLTSFFNVPLDKKLRETKRVMTVATAQVGVSAKDLPSSLFSSTMFDQKQHTLP